MAKTGFIVKKCALKTLWRVVLGSSEVSSKITMFSI